MGSNGGNIWISPASFPRNNREIIANLQPAITRAIRNVSILSVAINIQPQNHQSRKEIVRVNDARLPLTRQLERPPLFVIKRCYFLTSENQPLSKQPAVLIGSVTTSECRWPC